MITSTDISYVNTLYNSEVIVVGWISASLILLTSSLLFYHMTRVKSLEMDPRVAGIFAVSLIILSIFMSISAISNYNTRVDKLNKGDDELLRGEKKMSDLIVFMGGILAFVELGIGVTIILGIRNKYC